jgi:hypothetical protein
MTDGWNVVATAEGAHIMPIDDLRQHTANATCWCGPQQDEQDGLVIFIHGAKDHRQEWPQ